ncbi:hypothetical protein VNO77_19362 [Canavalia gladiata]|uniref:Uncharacterized protein n=1 Tax=Canavalia gladiata TaxID=3824 RepID=A0AAN9QKF2_CANGL
MQLSCNSRAPKVCSKINLEHENIYWRRSPVVGMLPCIPETSLRIPPATIHFIAPCSLNSFIQGKVIGFLVVCIDGHFLVDVEGEFYDPNVNSLLGMPIGVESPYLSAGLLGKLHVIIKGTNHNIIMLQADIQNDLVSSQPLSSLVNSSSELIESAAGSENKI